MPSLIPPPHKHSIELIWLPKPYKEQHYCRGQEPRKRWLCGFARRGSSQWHIKVSFCGSLHEDMRVRLDIRKRRRHLEELCQHLDWDDLRFLDDTVTEVFIRRDGDKMGPGHEWDFPVCDRVLRMNGTLSPDCEFAPYVAQLRFCLRVDPFHVRFPPFDYNAGIPTKELSDINKIHDLSMDRVHEVRLVGDDKPYIYKHVDMLTPLYEPQESEALDQELRNLQLIRGVEGIVQLVAAVVSRNPYQTVQDVEDSHTIQINGFRKFKPQVVLRGLLLEYHPNGTLKYALQSPQPNPGRPFRKWSLQISLAVSRLHERGIAHMDLKPSNVVIDADDNAVLIDISGIGGVTPEYLAPEMYDVSEYDVSDLLSINVEIRMRNDIWALGKMISQMADISIDNTEKQQLRHIALSAMANEPSSRTALPSIISSLLRSS